MALMNWNPSPHVHSGDHYREGSVCAVDLTGCGGTPNDGIRVRAELTFDELVDLHDALARKMEAVRQARLDALPPGPKRVKSREPWDPIYGRR